MIQINLRLLAYPLWAYAVFALCRGLYMLVTNLGTVDIGPMIGIAGFVFYGVQAVVAAVLGWLVWRAFRPG